MSRKAEPHSPVFAQAWKGGWQGEGREAGALQERDHVGDLPLHSSQDHQAKELIVIFKSFPPGESESRAAIGTRRELLPVSCRKKDSCREFSRDGCSSLEPERKRWHGEPGVLPQERYQARDVRLLPARHRAVKERWHFLDGEDSLFLC